MPDWSFVLQKLTEILAIFNLQCGRKRGQPTFLTLDKAYPDEVFATVVWGSDGAKFGRPEVTYRGKLLCATARIKAHRGVPEVSAYEPEQIAIESKQEM